MDSPASAKPADRRAHPRVPVKLYADLHWEGTDGQMNFARARVLDVSEGGVRLSLPACRLNIGVSVHLRIEQFGFAGYGIVHYARGDGILGVKLRFEAATKQELERWKKSVQSAQSSK
jgi:hypothetical protein